METNHEAHLRRACLDCGASDAGLYRDANDGRLLRVCRLCLHRWERFRLVDRDPLPKEIRCRRCAHGQHPNAQCTRRNGGTAYQCPCLGG